VFGSKLGWERPNWFALAGVEPKDLYSMGRQNWFDQVGVEHKAVRDAAGLFDQSSFAKYEVTGRDAERALSFICSNDVAKPPGRLTYTQMLNSRGGIECDLTVARLAPDRFYVVTGTGFRTHDLAWIRSHIGPRLDVSVHDVTEAFGTLSLMGPRARDILAKVTGDEAGDAAFPFGGVREIAIAGIAVRALRVTYVGELGWELHMQAAGVLAVYTALMSAGAPLGLRNAGYRALESLRLEKAYRAWGSDITPNDTPLEAGLGWAVKLKTQTDFLGRAALQAMAGSPPKKRLVTFTCADPAVTLLGRETILRDGAQVGYLTGGGFGYTISKPIGLGYVRNPIGVTDEWIGSGKYELIVAQDRVAAELHLAPLYDPSNSRVRS
jgi:sarcosine dehydrogenase